MDHEVTDAELFARLDDAQALRFTLFGEARGEPIEGRIAVGCLIRNRVADGRWGHSYKAVCLAPWQFSCWKAGGGAENHAYLLRIVRALLEGGPVPWTATARAIHDETAWVAEGVLSGYVRDRVKDATHYYSPAAMTPRGAVPDWAQGKQPVAVIGSHRFFAGVA